MPPKTLWRQQSGTESGKRRRQHRDRIGTEGEEKSVCTSKKQKQREKAKKINELNEMCIFCLFFFFGVYTQQTHTKWDEPEDDFIIYCVRIFTPRVSFINAFSAWRLCSWIFFCSPFFSFAFAWHSLRVYREQKA